MSRRWVAVEDLSLVFDAIMSSINWVLLCTRNAVAITS